MLNMKLATSIAAAGLYCFTAGVALAEEAHVAPIKEYVAANIDPWLSDATVVDAIKAQNAANASITQADIDKLDQDWRAQATAGSKPMVDAVLGNALSKFLSEKKAASGDMITEVFVTDAHGLNVGQSDVTSDYWQGDEAKWQKTFAMGPGAVFVDEVETDESTQALQSQVSETIVDPATGEAIGAITIGINLENL
ncbi:hypothetical protein DFR52_1081 [Hoeflea marina]|uniref:Uncharacterized protein n=1 Tax=Hoeflea marina TaxID=274592 RepID=A0A317PCL4_9HYPH|nr:hypothetical protein [Hoeflea marina]PWV95737.1 hypothetical protein DFR52_1081 [Hoeflea marina]